MLYNTTFITMALANLFTVSSFGAFFLFPLYIINHGGSKSDIGIIMGIFALSAVLSRPWISSMVDRIGRKRSYTVGCIIISILPLLYLLLRGGLSEFYLPLLFLRVIHGVGVAICFTAAFTYIADIIPPERLNEGIGMFGVTGLLGLAIGPVVAEIIIGRFGFDIFFLVTAGMAVMGLALHLPLRESYRRSADEPSRSFFSVMFRKRTLTVAMLAGLFGFGLSATIGFVTPFAREQAIAFISLYFICYSGAAVLTRLFGGRLADRVGEDRIIPYALVLTGAGLFALIFLEGNAVLIIAGLMSGCGHGFLFPCLNALAIRDEPIDIRGKITGVFTGGIDAGAFAGSLMLGYIGEWAGFRALFFTAGLALLLGLVVYRFRVMNGRWLVSKEPVPVVDEE
ncbi:MAG: MFS transporter [Syntrophobacterales bacterium]|nr:MFS transporter [Syntrophobacterales bacterium]